MLLLALFDAPNGTMIADLSSLAHDVRASTNEHGFAALSATVDLSLAEAFALYDRPGLPHVVLSDGAYSVFEGRLEDVTITDTGAQLIAFGYWRALSDAPYTALWSDTRVSAWEPIRAEDLASQEPDLYQVDTNNRIYITLVNGATYRSTLDIASMVYYAPSQGERSIARVTFSYSLLVPVDWRARLSSYTSGFASGTSEWTLDATGVLQTGNVTQNLASPNPIVTFELFNNAGSDLTFADETGTAYLKITNVRVMSTTASTVTADAIAGALATYINGINSTQLNTSTALIAAPGLDLTDEIYEDAYPADILTRLAGLGDNQTPPRQWEVGVWDDQQLHLRVRGSTARAWSVDAGSLDVQRSLETLANAAYGIYQDAIGWTQRTAVATDASSIARYGLTRRAAVPTQTTSSTQAGVHRDAYLEDRSTVQPRASITIPALYGAEGSQWPLWMARSGDTITIRNLPATLSLDVDRIRTFRIAGTEYHCDMDMLTVTPESPRPSVEVLLARSGI